MLTTPSAERGSTAFGGLLRDWRTARRMSQLALATQADVSARHVSFMETGRAGASADMVTRLAQALDVPLRERNLLLQAAGHAPAYAESSLECPELADIRHALTLILSSHEPFAAWVLDARWDLVMVNDSYARSLEAFWRTSVPALTVLPPPRPNLLHLLITVGREAVANWETVAAATLARAARDAVWHRDRVLEETVGTLARQAGLPPGSHRPGSAQHHGVVIPIESKLDGVTLRFFNTIATLGAPQDVMLQELRIEALHPANEETDRCVRQMHATAPTGTRADG